MHDGRKAQKPKQQSVTCSVFEVVPQAERIHLKFLSNQYHIRDKSFISTSCNKLLSKILEILRNSRSGFSFRTREAKDANRSLSEALPSGCAVASGLEVPHNFEQSSRKTSRGDGGITSRLCGVWKKCRC
jgi:hypothetical protein